MNFKLILRLDKMTSFYSHIVYNLDLFIKSKKARPIVAFVTFYESSNID